MEGIYKKSIVAYGAAMQGKLLYTVTSLGTERQAAVQGMGDVIEALKPTGTHPRFHCGTKVGFSRAS